MLRPLFIVTLFKEVRSLFRLITRSVPDFLGVLLCYVLVIVVWATVGPSPGNFCSAAAPQYFCVRV